MLPPKIQPDPANWWHYSFNQWWGCTKVSPACKFCYAEMFDRYAGRNLDPAKGLHWGKGVPRYYVPGFAKKIRALNDAYARHPDWPRPRVFMNSMNDWLDPEIPARWLGDLIAALKYCKALDLLLLTKHPQLFRERLMAVWQECPELRRDVDWWLVGNKPMNIWAGATVESQVYADLRIPKLLDIPAAVNWLSVEPPFSEVNLLTVGADESCQFNALQAQGIQWVVAGGESGARMKIRPSDPRWFQSQRDQCAATGTAFWFKQWGEAVGGLYHPGKSKVILQDGRIFWIQTEKQKKLLLHFWEGNEGVYQIVSARVGMKPKPLREISMDPPEPVEFSNNYLLDGKIHRDVPVPACRAAA